MSAVKRRQYRTKDGWMDGRKGRYGMYMVWLRKTDIHHRGRSYVNLCLSYSVVMVVTYNNMYSIRIRPASAVGLLKISRISK